MLRSAGAWRLRKTLRRCPAGAKKIARRNASWTWDVIHERALSPADLFGGRRQLEPELAFWSKFASAKAAQVLILVPL